MVVVGGSGGVQIGVCLVLFVCFQKVDKSICLYVDGDEFVKGEELQIYGKKGIIFGGFVSNS